MDHGLNTAAAAIDVPVLGEHQWVGRADEAADGVDVGCAEYFGFGELVHPRPGLCRGSIVGTPSLGSSHYTSVELGDYVDPAGTVVRSALDIAADLVVVIPVHHVAVE